MHEKYFDLEEVPEEDIGMIRDFAGIRVNVEHPAGTDRYGVDKHGTEWRTKMVYDYGFVSKLTGEDDEGVDVYLGPDQDAKKAYIIHQVDPDTSEYDEDKVMLGFDSEDKAKEAYLEHYDDPKVFGSMQAVTFDAFKKGIESGNGVDELGKWKKKSSHKGDQMKKYYFNLDKIIKKAQFDDYDVPDDWGVDDYNVWEEEQVFQDREGEDFHEEEEETGPDITIEPSFSHTGQRDGFEVVEHGVYGPSSVLEGQTRRTILDFFPTVEDAQQQYPEAKVVEHSTKTEHPELPKSPPSWFDPSAAGERWDSDY